MKSFKLHMNENNRHTFKKDYIALRNKLLSKVTVPEYEPYKEKIELLIKNLYENNGESNSIFSFSNLPSSIIKKMQPSF